MTRRVWSFSEESIPSDQALRSGTHDSIAAAIFRLVEPRVGQRDQSPRSYFRKFTPAGATDTGSGSQRAIFMLHLEACDHGANSLAHGMRAHEIDITEHYAELFSAVTAQG